MSSLSWDVPSSSTNPSVDDDDVGEVNGRGRPDGGADDHEESPQVDLADEEPMDYEEIAAMEREQIEALERELLGQLERGGAPGREQIESLEQFEAAEIELAEQSEREQIEELEREQLRQLGLLEPEANNHVAAAPPRPVAPPPPERPRPDGQTSWAPSAADAEARAAQFLAESGRRSAGEAFGAVPAAGPATERRELNEPARAARAIVDHRHRNLVDANALLTEARKVLAPIAYRGLSDRIYRRRKVILAIGEAVSLAVAFSTAFDVAPLEALLLSGAIALAFVIAGDLGGVLRLTAERSRLSAALEDDVVHLDPRYLHILYHDRQPWLSIIGGVTAAIFGLAAVSVGVLRASNQSSVGLAAGLGLLTVSLAIAAGLSSWQHASVGSEIIDHLQREEEAAARRLKRAAAARVLRRPQVLSVVGTDELETPSYAPDLDWRPPSDVDWQASPAPTAEPTAEMRVKRPRRAGGRAAREKPARREKGSGSGLVGSAAARGAVFLATLPGKLRRPEKAARGGKDESIEEMSVVGDGPGALGESAGPISTVAFRPPIQSPKKFG